MINAAFQAMELLHQEKAEILERKEKSRIQAYCFKKRTANISISNTRIATSLTTAIVS